MSLNGTLMELFVNIRASGEQQLRATFGELQTKANTLKSNLESVGKIASRAFLGTTGALALFVKKASDAGESLAKFHEVFKESSAGVEAWSQDLGKAINRSSLSIMGFAANVQSVVVPMGFARGKATELSKAITKLGYDLSSFHNIAEDEAIQRLTSALVGNHEAMRTLGVVITETTLDSQLLAMGFNKVRDGASEQEKFLARLELITKGTADAQGDAARTSTSLANSMRGLRDNISELATRIGQGLAPAMQNLISIGGGVVDWVKELSPATQSMIAKWGELTLVITGGLKVLPLLMSALNGLKVAVVALVSNPLVLLGSLLAAAGAAFLVAKANGQSFGDTVLELTAGIGGLLTALKELKNQEAAEKGTNELYQSAKKSIGTESAPETIKQSQQALQKRQSEMAAEATDQNASKEDRRFAQQEVERIGWMMKELAADFQAATAAAEKMKADREAAEEAEKQKAAQIQAEVDKAEGIKKQKEMAGGRIAGLTGGITQEHMAMLPGLGFLAGMDPRNVARGLSDLRPDDKRQRRRRRRPDAVGQAMSKVGASQDAKGNPANAANGKDTAMLDANQRQLRVLENLAEHGIKISNPRDLNLVARYG